MAVNLGVDCADCPGGKESTILGALHLGSEWPNNSLNSSEMYAPQVLDGFHTFGIVWARLASAIGLLAVSLPPAVKSV